MKDIPPIQIAPRLKGVCKIFAILTSTILLVFPLFFAYLFWQEYEELLISVGIFLFLQIVSGVITAKLRTRCVPSDQSEMSYSTYEIVSWYLSRYICKQKEKTDKSNMITFR